MTKPDDNPVLALLIERNRTVPIVQRQIADALHVWLQQRHPAVCDVLFGLEVTGWKQEDAEGFANELLTDSQSRRNAAQMLALFAAVVDEANKQYSRDLPVPPVPTIRNRPKTPWGPEEVTQHKHAKELVEVYESLLLDAMTNGSESQKILPLLVESALMFGGIAHQNSLVAMIRAVASSPLDWTYFGKRVQLELRISSGRGLPPERRIWYPDILSSLLLLRFQNRLKEEAVLVVVAVEAGIPRSDQHIVSWIWSYALSELRKRAKANGIPISRLNQLIQIMTTRYRRELPQFIVSFMTREILSGSLRRDRLANIHGFPSPAALAAASEAESNDDDEVVLETAGERTNSESDGDDDDRLRSDLLKVFSGEDRRHIRDNLATFAHACVYPPAKRTADFAAFLLKEKSAWGKDLRISTIRELTRLVAKMLWGILDGSDPKDLTASDLAGYYSEILEEVSDRAALSQSLSRALTEFHFFLVSRHRVETIDFREFVSGRGRSGSVDANLITDLEARRIRGLIKANTSFPDDPMIARAALAVFDLAIGGGTRRNETRYIRKSDLIYDNRKSGRIVEILVRPWGPHEQKSRHAARRVSRDLFEPDDWTAIEELIKQRISLAQEDENFLLFDWPTVPAGHAFDKIIALVLKAMRAVTNDPSIRFHHLRHTFCSKLLLELTLFSEGINQIEAGQWPGHLAGNLTNAELLRKRLRILCGTSRETRKVLFGIAKALGHGGSDTSCSYYQHLLDICTLVLLDHSNLMPGKTVLAAASGLSESQARDRMGKYGTWDLVARLLAPDMNQKQDHTTRASMAESAVGTWIDRFMEFFVSHRQRDLPNSNGRACDRVRFRPGHSASDGGPRQRALRTAVIRRCI
jgi:integrase